MAAWEVMDESIHSDCIEMAVAKILVFNPPPLLGGGGGGYWECEDNQNSKEMCKMCPCGMSAGV